MPPLEVWEKVLIDPEALLGTVHGYISCIDCHGGRNLADKAAAHVGVVRDPSVDAEAACGACHPDIAPFQAYSLHNNLAGYDTVLYQRSMPENHPAIEAGQEYHCQNCHTTCGQCHISQPTSVGGGLIDGHVFNRTPSMSRQCTACHGSRVKNEYTGAHEGLAADVHLRSVRMVCTDCHTGGDMHGTDYVTVAEDGTITASRDHRYDGPQGPSCESCHRDVVGIGSGNPYHEAHGTEVLSCQVCHSISYINCYDCHLERTEDDIAYYRLQHEEIGFYIGRNPIRSAERPYRYVPLRHVPTYPDLFRLYGEDVLNNFDSLPTWTYATPHNIQRNTPQTASCESCHTNNALFLTPDKVREEELTANQGVIVLGAPPMPEEYRRVPLPGEETAAPSVAPAAAPTADPLDVPPAGVDPLAVPPAAPTVDPLDVPSAAPTVDPLDVPSAAPTAAPTVDPLDVPPAK
ncbi:MAG: hypothetical protein HPY64_14120 [Anaerolineae bacterium]|nr:hypothetical protein [Anaerolineae bacterium]